MYSSAKRSGVGWERARTNRTTALTTTIPARTAPLERARGTERTRIRRAEETASTATSGLSAGTGDHLKEGWNEKGRGRPRPLASSRNGPYGPVQTVLVMSPPGPFFDQDFVPTVLLMQ